ncbi:beta-lactamase-like protein [Mycena crocata]|nr:beta-lactamase-like protein [Mycena crocata]
MLVRVISLSLFFLRCAGRLGIPASSATVEVKVFNVANVTVALGGALLQPILPGHEVHALPVHAFLIEHPASQTRLMFDLGIRKDLMDLAPSVSGFFESAVYTAEPFKDITELLEAGGIPLSSINTVIWSHAHFDHIGDMSLFPNSTDLVIGPGTNRSLYPESPDAQLRSSDFAGHKVLELNFKTAALTFSGLPALDFFGDGSFYLLDTPGHIEGHITALARVTRSSFVVLGADTAHHVGQLRPRPGFQHTYPCPAHIVSQARSAVSTDYFWSSGSRPGVFDIQTRTQPLLSVPDRPNSTEADPVALRVSIDKLADFDGDPDFFVVLAHDVSLIGVLPYFPASLSQWNWRGNTARNEIMWGFLDERNQAFRFSLNNTGN